MESSTLCKDAKQKKIPKVFKSSHSNFTKATSAREQLEMKNNGENQPMTPR
jgi:hypothetical protein